MIRGLLIVVALSILLPNPVLANDYKSFEGMEVKRIVFNTKANLSLEVLAEGLALEVGKAFSVADLEDSKARLAKRDIFEEIESSLSGFNSGVSIEFRLPLRHTVSSINASGNSVLTNRDIQRLSRLRVGDEVDADTLASAVENLKEGYLAEGFGHVEIKADLQKRRRVPEYVVKFQINEGYRSVIRNIEFAQELPRELQHLENSILDFALGIPASQRKIQSVRMEILRLLRREGYLQATVDISSVVYHPLSGDVDLVIRILAREPITINFSGSKLFSDEELLAPLRLETRLVPFTPNAVRTLCRRIQELYQQRGYFFAAATCEEVPSEGLRRFYQVTIDEGPLVRIGAIEFRGNDSISRRALRSQMQSQPVGNVFTRRWRPGFLLAEQLSQDLVQVERYYLDRGFHSIKTEFDIDFDQQRRRLRVIIDVKEGPRSKISAVKIVLDRVADVEPELLGRLLTLSSQIASGDVYSAYDIEAEERRLLRVIRNLGFPDARVEAYYVGEREELTFRIAPGGHIQVGEVFFGGNYFTSDRVLRREMRLEPGDFWDPELVQATERALYQRGIFRSVSVRPLDGELDGPVEDLLVAVQERDTGSVGLGVGYNTEDGVELSSEFGQRNLAGSGNALLVNFKGFFKSTDRVLDAGSARINYLVPRIFETRQDLISEGFFQYSAQSIEQYSFDRVGASSTLQRELTDAVGASLGLTVYRENLFDVAPAAVIGRYDEGDTLYSFLRAGLKVDYRDDVFNPKHGTLTELEGRVASKFLGSETDFVALSLAQSLFLPVVDSVVSASNFRARWIKGYEGGAASLSQRYFLGGRNSLRGFKRNSVGPKAEDGTVVGGDIALTFSTELQWSLMTNIAFLGFVDFGTAYLKSPGSFTGDRLGLDDVRYTPGLGLRYITPIGPLGVEYGFNPDRKPGEESGNLYIGIGSAF